MMMVFYHFIKFPVWVICEIERIFRAIPMTLCPVLRLNAYPSAEREVGPQVLFTLMCMAGLAVLVAARFQNQKKPR